MKEAGEGAVKRDLLLHRPFFVSAIFLSLDIDRVSAASGRRLDQRAINAPST